MAQSIRIENVTKWYAWEEDDEADTLQVIDDISFDVGRQEFVAIVGPSGCGKTTLLKMLDGLLEPSSGTIRVGDRPVTAPIPEIAMVFQTFELFPWRTVLENVWLGLEIQKVDKVERRERAMQWIRTVGLEGFEARYPYELSGGMQQRVGLARALVVNPEVLLMDEPFGALDAMTKDRMQTELLQLLETEHKTVVFVTHDVKEAIFLADRVLVMSPRPATIIRDLEVEFERPRWNRRMEVEEDRRFTALEREIRAALGLGG